MKGAFPCPNCGADVPAGARSCRECGSDEETGWAEADEVAAGSVELPEPDLPPADYERFLAREGLAKAPPRRRRIAWALGLLLLAALLLFLLR